MIHKHTITLAGPAADGRGLSGHVLRDLFDVLVQGAEQSLRFRLEGRSTARGVAPAWVRSASDFEMTDLERSDGTRTMRLEARPLIESMPEKFPQADLFDDFDPTRSPLEFFEDALEEAIEERSDSEAFDQALLKTCSDFRMILGAGIDSIDIQNGRTVRVDSTSIDRVVRLARMSYAARKVRLAGRLEIIGYSDCRFTLVLENGSKVPGTARDLGVEALREGFGKEVIVTGTAEFRPSGRILRIDADLVEPATASELKLFSVVPRPLLAVAAPERPTEKAGLAALLGQWPGEEPLDQLLAQLKALA